MKKINFASKYSTYEHILKGTLCFLSWGLPDQGPVGIFL
jgi:hypothetical protein